MTLVLVDIDGTLVDCGGQVRPLLAAALTEIYGLCGDIAAYEFGGKVDPQIVLDLLTTAGLDRAAVLAGLAAARARFLENLVTGLRPEAVALLPGADTFLQRLAARPDVRLGLVSGNWEPSGRHKLSAHDLNRFFEFGAFGDDGFDRSDLPPVAIARAEARTERRFAAREVWVVGDSRQDVECARTHGLRSVAVATGRTSAEQLALAGAEYVVPDLASALDVILSEAKDLRRSAKTALP